MRSITVRLVMAAMSVRRSPAIVLVLTLGIVLGCSSEPGATSPPPPPTATAVAFVSQPSNTTSGVAIAPGVTAELRDAAGNVVNSTASVTVAIANNPSNGTLSGTLSAAAVAGVATFSDLTIDVAATGYSLSASSTGLTSATSSAFSVSPGPVTAVAFVSQPSNTTSGVAIAPAVTVELSDAHGNGPNALVTLALANNPGGGMLTGTLSATSVAGLATFSDLTIDAVGTGYTLAATTPGTSSTSGAFNIGAAPAQLAFTTQPASGSPRQPIAMSVELRDAAGNVAPYATNDVIITFEVNNGSMLLHASGCGVVCQQPSDGPSPPRVMERVDPTNGFEILLTSSLQEVREVFSIAYDASSGTVYATTFDEPGTINDNSFLVIDPATGVETSIGSLGTCCTDFIRPITFSSGMLIGGTISGGPNLFSIDPATATKTLLGPVVVAGDAIDGYTGLATEPTTGTVYGAVILVSAATRKDRTLVTIDVASLTATVVGPLNQNGVASLTFLPDGTLLAMTGDGALVPETLWSVDKATGTMTFIATLGNGNDGEAIARVPAILSGTLSVAAMNGVADFTVQIDGPGDYSLKVSSAGLPDVVSSPFTLQ